MTLGQEFGGYAAQVREGIERVRDTRKRLGQIPLGGTAVGTGLNTHPDFAAKVRELLAADTGLHISPPADPFEAQAARDGLVEASGALKVVAVSLTKIANDLRLMGSGPRAGLAELFLPELQKGSSIMPGKVNPVIPEVVTQVAAQVIGNDQAITVGGLQGHFELNVFIPMMARNLLGSIKLLAAASRLLAEKCVDGIEANREQNERYAELTLSAATALNPHIGYDKASEIVKKAAASGRSLREVAREEGVDDATLDEALDFRRMAKPHDASAFSVGIQKLFAFLLFSVTLSAAPHNRRGGEMQGRRQRSVLRSPLAALALAVPGDRAGRKRQRQRPEGRRGPRWRHQGQEAAEAGACPRRCPRKVQRAVAAAAAEESPPIGTDEDLADDQHPHRRRLALDVHAPGRRRRRSRSGSPNNLNFPAGDCRNDGIRNVITAAQVSYFADQFDDNIEPKMSAAFSSPPSRDGTGALLEQLAPSLVPGGLLRRARASKIVTLIANFQDENYIGHRPSRPYVAGYHSSDINDVREPQRDVDRLVRLGPPHRREPAERAVDRCCAQNRPAQPFKYEGVFAHEYQHLLEFWASPGEVNVGRTRVSPTMRSRSRATASRPARSSRPATTATSRPSSGGGCCRRRRTRSRSRTAAPRTRSRCGTTRAGSRRSPTTAPSTRSWSTWPAATGRAFMTDLHNEDANGLVGPPGRARQAT